MTNLIAGIKQPSWRNKWAQSWNIHTWNVISQNELAGTYDHTTTCALLLSRYGMKATNHCSHNHFCALYWQCTIPFGQTFFFSVYRHQKLKSSISRVTVGCLLVTVASSPGCTACHKQNVPCFSKVITAFQGAFFGSLTGFAFVGWISLGAYVQRPFSPVLQTSTEDCAVLLPNVTTTQHFRTNADQDPK